MTSTTPDVRRDDVLDPAAGVTQTVAAFAARPRQGTAHVDAVGRVLVDTVAVAVAGVETDGVECLLDWVRSEPTVGPARVWGSDLYLSPSQAALVNGTAAHALDWDDAVPSVPLHPGAVIIPALLARLSVTSANGGRLVAAYDVGSAVARAVSEVLPVDHHAAAGWHNTSTTGRLAATAAVAQLVGLDVERTRQALGIAASTAAGSLANFGTMTKPLHAGLAARDAVMAVALAERGFTASPTALEEPRGFLAMYGTGQLPSDVDLAERLDRWETDWVHDWTLKRYPSCYATHRAIDAVLRLRTACDPRQVVAVEVSVPASVRDPLLRRLPDTGLEGKFSLEYAVARALVSGHVGVVDFTDEAVRESRVQELIRTGLRIERRPVGQASDGCHTSVTVTLSDGRTLQQGVDITHGDARNPLSDEELADKAIGGLASVGWTEPASRELVSRLAAAPRDTDLDWLQTALGRTA